MSLFPLKKIYWDSWLLRLRAVSLFSWSVEQNARDKQMTTRVTEGARRERHDALVSRVSRLRRSTLARACTPLTKFTKSEEKERLLAVCLGLKMYYNLCELYRTPTNHLQSFDDVVELPYNTMHSRKSKMSSYLPLFDLSLSVCGNLDSSEMTSHIPEIPQG